MTARVGRLHSLDGLRGVAAAVVLIHHSLLLIPRFAEPYYLAGNVENPFIWAMTYTPLHLLWMGTEAVFVFFVLSGVVLALQVTRSRSFSWKSYFPSRLVRLYVPVIGAVLFALLLVTLVQRSSDQPLFSAWAIDRAREYTPPGVLHDMVLLRGTSGVVSPLWSLRWEVIFSLALPIYTWVAARRYGSSVAMGSALLLTIFAGAYFDLGALIYLPVFGIGVLLAVRWTEFVEFGQRLNDAPNPRPRWAAVAVLTAVLLSAYWLARGLGTPEPLARLAWPLVAVGAVLLVLMACTNHTTVQLLTTKSVQWLGKISFSLYLVHEPILLTARHATPGLPEWVPIALGVPASVMAAVIFWHLVERPSHVLAKTVQVRLRPKAPANAQLPADQAGIGAP
jgi:peptidoglycan/LPS O-acetylase OafA/YrhL